jgi:hypothetical protein
MLEEEVNDHVTVDAVHGKAEKDGEVADCPNEVSGSFVHSLVLVRPQKPVEIPVVCVSC